jgi:hypothetical protein
MTVVKTTAPGAPVDSFDELIGDPFRLKGERIHDRPSLSEVNSDLEAMDHALDNLHIDLGVGGTPLPGPENAAAEDVRARMEREMRDRVIGGPTDGNPLQHGHTMATRFEDYIRYSPGEIREAITEQAQAQDGWADNMLAEYAARWPDLAADTEALSVAVEAAMEQVRRNGHNPARWAQENPDLFLREVELDR